MTAEARTAATSFINLFIKSEEAKQIHYCFAPESDKEIILHNLHFAEKLFPHHALMLCPRSHPGFKYMTQNCEKVLQHDYKFLMDLDLPDFFTLIHAEDLPAVKQCFDFIQGCEPLDPEMHRFSMYFRFRDREGEYLHIHLEHIAIKTLHNNYLYIMLLRDVSKQEKFHHVKLEVHKNINGTFVNIYTYNPRNADNEITPRQHEIAKLIQKGYSNQEIADLLHVSIFTVKNHKRTLFKKMNVKSSVELARYAY